MTGHSIIQVVLIEDQRDLRDGLAALINGTPGYAMAAGFGTMEDALAAIGRSVPNVVLVDLGLPGMSGVEGIRRLKERYPELSIIVLTVYGDDERIFGAICAGACGYLLKNTPPARLLESLQEAVSGGAPMSPEVARRVMELFRRQNVRSAEIEALTPHELRVLKLLSDGHNFRSAAAELGVSVHGITFHMRQIYDKLHVHSKAEAIAKALRDRIIE